MQGSDDRARARGSGPPRSGAEARGSARETSDRSKEAAIGGVFDVGGAVIVQMRETIRIETRFRAWLWVCVTGRAFDLKRSFRKGESSQDGAVTELVR